jgi:hypothetical protein
MDNSIWKRLVASVILLILTVASIWFIVNMNNQKRDLPVGDIKPISVQSSDFPDYDALTSLTPIALVKAVDSNMTNIMDPQLTKHIEIKGNFSRLYLYTELSVNDKPLTDWDSLYVKFDNTGGHLFRPDTLKVPTDNKATRLLYNTSVVPYLTNTPYSETRTPQDVDWFDNVFTNKINPESIRNVRFDTFISTTQNGTIHLIALYYSCMKETPDCYIKLK